MAIPGDGRIEEKELEKISKYQNQKIEKVWKEQANVVPVVKGSLGAIPRDIRKHLRTIGLESISPSPIQRTVLLGTPHILRKYLRNS